MIYHVVIFVHSLLSMCNISWYISHIPSLLERPPFLLDTLLLTTTPTTHTGIALVMLGQTLLGAFYWINTGLLGNNGIL